MDAKENGKLPAAPRPKWWPTDGDPDADGYAQGGLTKREAFAMAAMQGMLAACEGYGNTQGSAQNLAQIATQYADALLAELAKEN